MKMAREGAPTCKTSRFVSCIRSFGVGRPDWQGDPFMHESVDHPALGSVVPIGRGEQAPQGLDGPASAPLSPPW